MAACAGIQVVDDAQAAALAGPGLFRASGVLLLAVMMTTCLSTITYRPWPEPRTVQRVTRAGPSWLIPRR